jgi:hypothetical protein
MRVPQTRTPSSLTGARSSRQLFSFNCGQVDSGSRRPGLPRRRRKSSHWSAGLSPAEAPSLTLADMAG